MKKLLFIGVILMQGCATTLPVSQQKFPDPPSELTPPSKLILLNSKTTKMSDLLNNANSNYGMYYEDSAKLQGWIEWYIEQKGIHDSIK